MSHFYGVCTHGLWSDGTTEEGGLIVVNELKAKLIDEDILKAQIIAEDILKAKIEIEEEMSAEIDD